MVKNQFNHQIRIRIRIFTNIEAILPCHTPNMSTKFPPIPETTFWDIVLHIIFGPISQWWRITWKIFVVASESGSSPKSNQFLLVIHPTFPQDYIQIRAQLFEISCTQTNKQTDRQTRRRPRAGHGTCKIHKTNLTSKIIGGSIQWPNIQLLFKFQVNRMKINNFRNSAYVDLLANMNLQKNWWLNSETWSANPVQISSQLDENCGF